MLFQVSATPLAVGILAAGITGTNAQSPYPDCNPNARSIKQRIECLTKTIRFQRAQLSALENDLKQYQTLSSACLKPSDLPDLLAGYVKYGSPVAINLFAEPQTNQSPGRCLEAFPGEVGVTAHKPCNYSSSPELKWQLLPAPNGQSKSR